MQFRKWFIPPFRSCKSTNWRIISWVLEMQLQHCYYKMTITVATENHDALYSCENRYGNLL